jgi:hypothetical protein
MTTELEKEFFKVFGIEPKHQDACIVEDKYWQNEELANKYGTFDMYMNAKCGNQENCTIQCSCAYTKEIYPEITDRKLLEMICIYNSFQNDEASLFIPFDINNVKDIALQVITKSINDKSLNNYYCNDAEKLKTKIQKLFEEEE